MIIKLELEIDEIHFDMLKQKLTIDKELYISFEELTQGKAYGFRYFNKIIGYGAKPLAEIELEPITEIK